MPSFNAFGFAIAVYASLIGFETIDDAINEAIGWQ
jgi:hypothetical protein